MKRLLGKMEVRKEQIEGFVEVVNKIISSSHFLSLSSRSLLRSLLVRLYGCPFWVRFPPLSSPIFPTDTGRTDDDG